jgi:prepilin-type N-terminal cleavage/methylation domain-containing protein
MFQRGFTLVEMLIVLAIALLLFAVIGSIASNTYPKHSLRAQTDVVIQTLREAQAFTLARKYDSVWGVHLTSSGLTLFAGASYAARNATYDQTHSFPSGITVSGLTDVVFDALRGTTSQTGTITLTSNATSESNAITINANGVIEQ